MLYQRFSNSCFTSNILHLITIQLPVFVLKLPQNKLKISLIKFVISIYDFTSKSLILLKNRILLGGMLQNSILYYISPHTIYNSTKMKQLPLIYYPFRAPIITPFIKYFLTKGYKTITGKLDTIINEYFSKSCIPCLAAIVSASIIS